MKVKRRIQDMSNVQDEDLSKKIKPLTTFVKGYEYKYTLRYDKIAR